MNIRRFLADKFQLYWLALNYWLDGDDWCDAVMFARRIVEGFVR